MRNKHILIIEDDADIAEIERDFLEIEGFTTELAADGNTGLARALSGEHSLIVLDLMLPGVDGLSICKQIRGVIDVPILMVTAKTDDMDKVRGLGLGADDYLAKPFSPSEFVARVKAHLAQYERLKGESADAPLVRGALHIDAATRTVTLHKRELELTNKEYELLCFLATHPGRVFSKETLYDQIWGADLYGDAKTVTVHINRLREKLEDDPAAPVYIQTLRGAGYRFSS